MLKRIEEKDFDKIYALMDLSFPVDEHRPYEGQKALLKRPFYQIYGVKEEEEIRGFLAVWEFDEMVYVEHFAVNPDFRNGGIGASMLRELEAMSNKRICLEVEYPETEMAIRRIGFYERNGFSLNEYPYIQPALAKGQNEIPLKIMTTGGVIDLREFEDLKALLYHHVFGILD